MTKKALYLKVIGPVFITKPEFAKFLSKNLTKKFTRFDPGACPLAIASGCIVTSHEYVPGAKVKGEYVEEGQMQMLPKWASRFVYRVDSDGDKSIITGKEALAVLKKIK